MKNTRATDTSKCVLCGGRLRNAVFCPICGRSSCSWACSARHVAQHGIAPAVYPGDATHDERPDPASEQALAR
ncbi:MAG: hypothetical protein ACYC61_03980 [Isosphaeraceae bacterium]